jgi:ribosomal protein S18 acetylase RimI-like enzyme
VTGVQTCALPICNKSAISFYEKNGYFRYKVIDDYYQETGESAFLMVKNIKKIMKI